MAGFCTCMLASTVAESGMHVLFVTTAHVVMGGLTSGWNDAQSLQHLGLLEGQLHGLLELLFHLLKPTNVLP